MSPRATWIPYLLIAPSVLFLCVLFLVPLVQTLWLSVSSEDGISLANSRAWPAT